jgi:hypothetical protein
VALACTGGDAATIDAPDGAADGCDPRSDWYGIGHGLLALPRRAWQSWQILLALLPAAQFLDGLFDPLERRAVFAGRTSRLSPYAFFPGNRSDRFLRGGLLLRLNWQSRRNRPALKSIPFLPAGRVTNARFARWR